MFLLLLPFGFPFTKSLILSCILLPHVESLASLGRCGNLCVFGSSHPDELVYSNLRDLLQATIASREYCSGQGC